ncbi:MAG: GIY-YIG nuclease family protein [Chitinophagaceae bacterium]|jgi:putative endonuclease|nr:MAG: GIY-YIG nuclease family protein [Chitinophagaceae bacterium]
MHFIYILYSPTLDRFYVGESSDPQQRLKWHNEHVFKNAYTKSGDDWHLVLTLEFSDRKNARRIERYIKSMKSSSFIKRLSKDSEFLSNFKTIVKENSILP